MQNLGEPKIVKIRKPRQCFGCLRKFAVGADMTRAAFTDGGNAYSVYTCAVCEAVFAEWDSHDQQEGYNEGDVRDACPETWEAHRCQIEGREEDRG